MLEEATELYVKLRRSPKIHVEWGSNYETTNIPASNFLEYVLLEYRFIYVSCWFCTMMDGRVS